MRNPRVNLSARRMMSRLMRAFACGQLTNVEFEEMSDGLALLDDAVAEAYVFAWGYYCDVRTHRIEGPWRFNAEQRRAWARWVLLLRTAQPSLADLPRSPMVAVGCGLFIAIAAAGVIVTGVQFAAPALFASAAITFMLTALVGRLRASPTLSESSPYPFLTHSHEDAARALNVFLCGGRTSSARFGHLAV